MLLHVTYVVTKRDNMLLPPSFLPLGEQGTLFQGI